MVQIGSRREEGEGEEEGGDWSGGGESEKGNEDNNKDYCPQSVTVNNKNKNKGDDDDDAVGKGLCRMVSSVIVDFDSRAEETLRSQHLLNSALQRLTGELDQLLEDAPLPFIMQHAAKISSVGKRVCSLNTLLKSIQHRIDKIDRLLTLGLLQGLSFFFLPSFLPSFLLLSLLFPSSASN
ncbi:hypothetical protein Tsubulata_007708 [Turnera subulata]|uniref:Biogenesis of lysosome-related organelles complex 1 subunit 7 n=1 Tax=Turnera subulata TaxID=218843 RepID=A0A9Q0G7Q5_9ROSI|nr:hypothetical protein Tsubulata_007708 [Turnera subulata]